MTNTVTISCKIDTTDASVPLGLEVWIDNHKFFDSDHVKTSEALSMEINDDEAEHELRFVMKNKTGDHTQSDESGNIVKDATLIVSDLEFDEIKLGHMVVEKSVYTHDFNGFGQLAEHKFYGPLGCNGTVSLKFSTPIYMWLLENM
jgi:hypothetical protein